MNAKKENKQQGEKKCDRNKFYKEMRDLSLKPTDSAYYNFLLVQTENFVKDWLNRMTKTQMRNVFELIRDCNSLQDVNMTKPKLIYTAGRLSGEAKKFLLELSTLVTNVENEEDMGSLKKFIETVLAYHKYYALN
ncbi:type III-A CRISPR-associated protein Csm2 [Phocaeicola abscessus]|uniref:type III-A CRISPR-associated protein Csm2 n=1 Tax=Phocaeicola abscessus TaxID=555313 RepID=UPI0028E6ECE3|nr:type III-A CRISPR-associated protein Csm2 [Phocaeicola abscessus]